MTAQFDGFDRVILCAGAHCNTFAGMIDCLVMETVHIQAGTGILPEPASALRADSVADFASAGRLLHVIQCFFRDQRHVLPDRPPACHA